MIHFEPSLKAIAEASFGQVGRLAREVNEHTAALEARIAKLEEMIRESPIGFYAEKGNYTMTESFCGCLQFDKVIDDKDGDFKPRSEMYLGRRARAYEEKYKDELNLIRSKNKETKEG